MEQSVNINKTNEYCETPLLKPSYNGIKDSRIFKIYDRT